MTKTYSFEYNEQASKIIDDLAKAKWCERQNVVTKALAMYAFLVEKDREGYEVLLKQTGKQTLKLTIP
jgi:hypothetical protein